MQNYESTLITRFVGIDPSAQSTGIAVLGIDGEVIDTACIIPRKLREQDRLLFLRDGLREVLSQHVPVYGMSTACIEGPALKAINKADTLGQVRGVFLVALADFKIHATVIQPTMLKKFATRSGAAQKDAMIAAALYRWPYLDSTKINDDIADALWLAHIAHSLLTDKVHTRKQAEVILTLKEDSTETRIPGKRILDL